MPTKEDFDNLLTYIGNNHAVSSNFLSLIMKSDAWTEYVNLGTDYFGFSALPAGNYSSEIYGSFGDNGFFWSSTDNDNSFAYMLYLGGGNAGVFFTNINSGYSVRCLKDSN